MFDFNFIRNIVLLKILFCIMVFLLKNLTHFEIIVYLLELF